ncbi:MAG: putative metal-binding motif-containing protein [Myxococcota bacterium]|nr:putative metal-binding motif-containing protein [Myxococcota bacterium]
MKLTVKTSFLMAALAFGFSACSESEKQNAEPCPEDTVLEDSDVNVSDADTSDTEDSDAEEVEESDPGDAIDDDGDGQSENDGDCNDEDATVYLGASDDLVDGIDQNCDGRDGPECTNDDSFVNLSAGFANEGITSCDDALDGPTMSCSTDLEWIDSSLQGQTIANYCGCACPEVHQEAPYCLTLTMTDSGGDGWNGAYVYIDMVMYELETGSEKSVEVCNVELSGCTKIFYVRGQKPQENAWSLSLHGIKLVAGGNISGSIGTGCSFFPGSCNNCQSWGLDHIYCGDGNYGGMFNGCATIGDGVTECHDGRDEVGGTYTCDPYNYFPPE